MISGDLSKFVRVFSASELIASTPPSESSSHYVPIFILLILIMAGTVLLFRARAAASAQDKNIFAVVGTLIVGSLIFLAGVNIFQALPQTMTLNFDKGTYRHTVKLGPYTYQYSGKLTEIGAIQLREYRDNQGTQVYNVSLTFAGPMGDHFILPYGRPVYVLVSGDAQHQSCSGLANTLARKMKIAVDDVKTQQ